MVNKVFQTFGTSRPSTFNRFTLHLVQRLRGGSDNNADLRAISASCGTLFEQSILLLEEPPKPHFK